MVSHGGYASPRPPYLSPIMCPLQDWGEGIGIYASSIPAGMTIGPMFGLEILKG